MSDSYDAEWGTSSNAAVIRESLNDVYDRISGILGGKPPIYIVDLVHREMPTPIPATFTEKEWRIIRFALERAEESI
jgi:hypothetical protein